MPSILHAPKDGIEAVRRQVHTESIGIDRATYNDEIQRAVAQTKASLDRQLEKIAKSDEQTWRMKDREWSAPELRIHAVGQHLVNNMAEQIKKELNKMDTALQKIPETGTNRALRKELNETIRRIDKTLELRPERNPNDQLVLDTMITKGGVGTGMVAGGAFITQYVPHTVAKGVGVALSTVGGAILVTNAPEIRDANTVLSPKEALRQSRVNEEQWRWGKRTIAKEVPKMMDDMQRLATLTDQVIGHHHFRTAPEWNWDE